MRRIAVGTALGDRRRVSSPNETRRSRREMRTVRYWIGLAVLAVVCALAVLAVQARPGPSTSVGPPPVTATRTTPTTDA